jgi:glycosyltransferase involved in cell wall biosynthesis
MSIPESDISILIPTYRYRDKVVRALQSALASGAGEIIVVDDRGQDGTIERLAEFSDPRLIVRENDRNLGLWENHLVALSMATRPWIKFIQADDYLLPGGLAAYAAAVDEGVTVVWAGPTVKDDLTGETMQYHTLARRRRVKPRQLQAACLCVGWILGSPSHMMLRSEAIERDPEAWQTRISADLVVGSIAAARGDTVLVPHGALGQGAHPLQDAKMQSSHLILDRTVRSLAYLRNRPEPGLRRFSNLWTVLNFKSMLKTVSRGILRREDPTRDLIASAWHMGADLSVADWREIIEARAQLIYASGFRKSAKLPIDLDAVFRGLPPASNQQPIA